MVPLKRDPRFNDPGQGLCFAFQYELWVDSEPSGFQTVTFPGLGTHICQLLPFGSKIEDPRLSSHASVPLEFQHSLVLFLSKSPESTESWIS